MSTSLRESEADGIPGSEIYPAAGWPSPVIASVAEARRQATGSVAIAAARISRDDVILPPRALETYGALRFQLPDDGDDLLLGCFHFLDLDGPERFQIFLQHLGAALRHLLQDVVLELLAGALQGEREDLAVHLAQHFLDSFLAQ